jgi:hypothetical protein
MEAREKSNGTRIVLIRNDCSRAAVFTAEVVDDSLSSLIVFMAKP